VTKKQLLTYTEKNNLSTHSNVIENNDSFSILMFGYEVKAKKGYAPRFVNWFKITSVNNGGAEYVSFDHQYDMYTGKVKRGFTFGFRLRQSIEKKVTNENAT